MGVPVELLFLIDAVPHLDAEPQEEIEGPVGAINSGISRSND